MVGSMTELKIWLVVPYCVNHSKISCFLTFNSVSIFKSQNSSDVSSKDLKSRAPKVKITKDLYKLAS